VFLFFFSKFKFMSEKGLIYDIRRYCVHDGPGIRTTVFMKGCPLHCWWCHNPESQSPEMQSQTKEDKLDERIFSYSATIGEPMTVAELMQKLEKDAVFFEESGGGITFSGGEPLMQPDFLMDAITACKNSHYHVAVDTCGFAKPEVIEKIAAQTDLFLYDLKMMDEESHKKYTGVSNRLILENLNLLIKLNAPVIIRFPVIPGINDTEANISQMLDFLNSMAKKPLEIHLLPYHSIAKNKYRNLGMENKLNELQDLKNEDVNRIKTAFESAGFMVKIGG